MDSVSNNNNSNFKIWAKLVSQDPEKDNITLTTNSDQTNQYQIDGEWKIYQDATGDTRIVCLSVSCIKVDDIWLGMNEEKKLQGGEMLAFSEDRNRGDNVFDYIFCLGFTESVNNVKRKRDNSLDSLTSIFSNQEEKKLIKIEKDLVQELNCSICLDIICQSASLNPCQHTFCSQCLWKCLKVSIKCPLCRTDAVSVGKNPHLQNSQDPRGLQPAGLVGFIFKDKTEVYVGGYVNGKKEGKGRLFMTENGEESEGDWVKGQRDGFGTMKYANGDIYNGEWKNNMREGKGVLLRGDGAKYEGDWKINNFNGIGKYTWESSAVYEGNWINGNRNGQGIMKYKDGYIYKGEWKNDWREGKGVFLMKNGAKYEGDWKKNNFNGIGKFKWRNGAEYEGNWVRGKICGQGIMKYQNGNIYNGEWKNDTREGKGTLILKDGVLFQGNWISNVFQPPSEIKHLNEDRYEGEISSKAASRNGGSVQAFNNRRQEMIPVRV